MKRYDRTEEYYAARDHFMRYVAEQVNPAREKYGLPLISNEAASECYRLCHDEPWLGEEDE